LGFSDAYLRGLIDNGKFIGGVRPFGKRLYYVWDDVVTWVNNLQRVSPPPTLTEKVKKVALNSKKYAGYKST
tara:strand:+ start:289 stop:504 length:216 start_codon:yes stop_codon:yes gene_type:complete